jgi:hypothetical protein
MPARVRMGARYTYRPALIDLIDPKTTLAPGDIVRVVRLRGCPPPNTMGHCHVYDAAGKLRGLVLTNSLQREST